MQTPILPCSQHSLDIDIFPDWQCLLGQALLREHRLVEVVDTVGLPPIEQVCDVNASGVVPIGVQVDTNNLNVFVPLQHLVVRESGVGIAKDFTFVMDGEGVLVGLVGGQLLTFDVQLAQDVKCTVQGVHI